VVLQQHRNGRLETIAEMAEDRCAKLMGSGGVAAVLTVTFHLTSGSWRKDVRWPSAKDYALTSAPVLEEAPRPALAFVAP
jgi:hypothetical protein